MTPSPTGGDRDAICYIAGEYPAVSHTFIDREVQALRNLGFRVETVSLHRTAPDRLLTPHDRDEDARTWAIQPIRPVRLALAHVRALTRNPARYLSTLRLAQTLGAPGPRGALWKVFYWAEAVALADHLRRREVHHVHAHFANSSSWVALLAARLNSGTWSFTMHGPTEFDDVDHFALPAKIEDAAFVACIGDYCRVQLMRKADPAQWDKLLTVRCGVGGTQYSPASETRARCGPMAPLSILSVARMAPDKGQRILISALALLHREGIDFKARLVGDGPDREEIEALVAVNGLGDRVQLLGNVGQDRLPDLYRASDLFVLSSFAEGIPVVLMEAMACKVPVVAPSVMGVGELVIDGVTGRLVQPGRPDLLAAAIRRVNDQPDEARELAEAGRALVADQFTYPSNVQPLAAAFSRVLTAPA